MDKYTWNVEFFLRTGYVVAGKYKSEHSTSDKVSVELLNVRTSGPWLAFKGLNPNEVNCINMNEVVNIRLWF